MARNPRAVLAYYSTPPHLLGVEVHSARLHRDGPTLELQIEIPCFPDRPSPRWPMGANAVQAVLRFVDVREVALSGWGTTNVGDLVIAEVGGVVEFRFECPTAKLVGVAGFFDVTSVSGYIRNDVCP